MVQALLNMSRSIHKACVCLACSLPDCCAGLLNIFPSTQTQSVFGIGSDDACVSLL